MIYLNIYIGVYFALAVSHFYLLSKLQRKLIAMKADLPPEYLYFTSAIIPFTKKENVFKGLRKGRLDSYGTEIQKQVKAIVWLQNIGLIMFLIPAAILGVFIVALVSM